MAIAKYKAVKDYFNPTSKKGEDEVHVSIGHVFVLDTDEARADVERGRLVLQKYLDPEDENDASEIEHFKDNPTGTKKRKVVVEEEPKKKGKKD